MLLITRWNNELLGRYFTNPATWRSLKSMERLPFFADVREKPVLVIGGGSVGARKAAWVIRAGASVDVWSPDLHEQLSAQVADGYIHHINGIFDAKRAPLKRYRLVIGATGHRRVNAAIERWCDLHGFWFNAVDDQSHGNVQFPAVVDRGPVQIAISSGGSSPVLARQIRERIESLLPATLGSLARGAAKLRQTLVHTGRSLNERRLVLERFVREGWGRSEAELSDDVAIDSAAWPSVWLVGAGPGDPDLLTLKAQQAMQTADVIVHDRLVSKAVLDRARRDARFISVGKKAGQKCISQDEINAVLIREARAGHKVCRLKGGDPGVFGRVGEEAEALREAGIDYQIVPGVTAALAAAASAGIGLTHRDHAHAVVFATAHGKDEAALKTLASLLAEDRTVCVYMGVGSASALVSAASIKGISMRLPVLIAENASRPDQRLEHTSLGKLVATLASKQIKSPALITIGRVAATAVAQSTGAEARMAAVASAG